MAKTKITDYSATRASNSEIDDISIAEGCPAGNVNDAIREIMVQLAEANAGTYPLADTWTFGASADLTKRLRYDLSMISTGTTRILTMPDTNVTITSAGAAILDDADAAAQRATLSAPSIADLGYKISGLGLVNSAVDATNDIQVGLGRALSIASSPTLMVLSSSITKQLDAGWAAGTNQGMRYSGAAIADGTYHIYLVSKALGVDADIYADPSAVLSTVLTHLKAETGGGDYAAVRRIGSILRESGAIVGFSQKGSVFLRTGMLPLVVNTTTLGTTAAVIPAAVPTGIKVDAILEGWIYHASAGTSLVFTSPDQLDQAPNGSGPIVPSAGGFGSTGQRFVRTNTSGEIRVRSDVSATTLRLSSFGWIDERDQ